jgi:hypothetical protein
MIKRQRKERSVVDRSSKLILLCDPEHRVFPEGKEFSSSPFTKCRYLFKVDLHSRPILFYKMQGAYLWKFALTALSIPSRISGYVTDVFDTQDCSGGVREVNVWENTCADWMGGFSSFRVKVYGGSGQRAYICGNSTVATVIGRMGEMATSCLVTVLGAARGAILQAHLHFEGMEVRH